MNNLAMLYSAEGRYDKAEPLFQQALEINRSTLGENHPAYANTMNNIGLLYYTTGNYAKAEPLFQQALEINRSTLGENHLAYANTMNNIAILKVTTDRANEGLKIMKQLNSLHAKMISQALSIPSEYSRLTYLQMLRSYFSIFLSLIVSHYPSSQLEIGDAFDLALKHKALREEALAIGRGKDLGIKYPQLKPKLQELNTLQIQIDKLALGKLQEPSTLQIQIDKLSVEGPILEAEEISSQERRLQELTNKKKHWKQS
jgi:tetratricopeptide (TPR) repeat protein